MASKSRDAFSHAKGALSELEQQLKDMVSSERQEIGEKDNPSCEIGAIALKERQEDLMILDPPISQCKGKRKKPQRFKPLAETNIKKKRTCSICHKKESHNKRTCPLKNDRDMGKKMIEHEDDDEEDEDLKSTSEDEDEDVEVRGNEDEYEVDEDEDEHI